MKKIEKTKEQVINEFRGLSYQNLDTVLTESEGKYRQLFVTVTDAIMVFDADTRQFVDVNEAALRLYGYKREEFLKLKHTDITAEPKESDVSIKQTLKGKLARIPLRYHKKKDGTVFPVEISAGAFSWKNRKMICGVIRNITERKQAEEKIKRDYHIQDVTSQILRTSLQPISLEEQLNRILDLIIAVPWLTLQSKGCIYLVEDDSQVLVMKVHRQFSESLLNTCKSVPIGTCLCGRAASTRTLIFTDRVDDRHDNNYEGMTDHGHYCVPVLSGERILGVINLYVRKEHERKKDEEKFLLAVANTLAGIIERKQTEEALKKSFEALQERETKLEELNSALRVLLRQRDQDRKELEEDISSKLTNHIVPYIELLRKRFNNDQKNIVNSLESNIKSIISSLIRGTSAKYLDLTPTEIRVTSLIKEGKTTKEIAELLHLSENTIMTHRYKIRSKLGLKNKKINITAYLQSIN